MSAKKGAPEPGTYRHCLRKIAEHDAEIEEVVSGWDEATYTRDVSFPDGKRRRAVFIQSDHFRDRLLKLGWEDATELLRAPPAAPVETKPPGRKPVARVAG